MLQEETKGTIIYPELEALRYLIEEQKKKIEALEKALNTATSCCCNDCMRHNIVIKQNIDGVGGEIW